MASDFNISMPGVSESKNMALQLQFGHCFARQTFGVPTGVSSNSYHWLSLWCLQGTCQVIERAAVNLRRRRCCCYNFQRKRHLYSGEHAFVRTCRHPVPAVYRALLNECPFQRACLLSTDLKEESSACLPTVISDGQKDEVTKPYIIIHLIPFTL